MTKKDKPSKEESKKAAESPTPPAYPDVDPAAGPTDEPLYPDAEAAITALEKAVKLSHGLHSDKELMARVAAYLRSELNLPLDEGGSDSER